MTNGIGFATPSIHLGNLALETIETSPEQKAKATEVIESWLPGDHADIIDMLGLAK